MKTFKEASYKVNVAGLPPIFIDAKSPTEIRKKLRRQLKFPDDIENIERITKGEKIKSFKDRLKSTLSSKGQDVKEMNKPSSDHMAKLDKIPVSQMTPAQKKANAERRKEYVAFQKSRRVTPFVPHPNKVKEDYSKGLDGKKLKASKSNKPLIAPYEEDKASEDMLLDPTQMAKKTKFLSPQNTDKLKTDLATLKKRLGPNHPLNKNSKVDEQTVNEYVALARFIPPVYRAAVSQSDKIGAAATTAYNVVKKVYNKVTSKKEDKDPAEYDQEGDMAKGQLKTMIDAAQELHSSLGDNDNLPEWVQSKITKATDYIDSVRDYMASEKDDD